MQRPAFYNREDENNRLALWGGGGGPACQVDVRIDRSGGVTVMCGTQDLGTGTRTFMAAIVADTVDPKTGQPSKFVIGCQRPSVRRAG